MKRLRPKYSDEELNRIYSTPHDHTKWSDHLIRVDVTIQVAKWMIREYSLDSAADLSCGNGAIIDALGVKSYKGDFAKSYEFSGPLEQTLDKLPKVGLYICSETLEHLDNPQIALRKIRDKAQAVVLSTPNACWNDSNPEHYWAWDTQDLKYLLEEAGFTPVLLNELNIHNYMYDYQIWAAV